MQYTSRIYLKFKDKEKWEYFLKEFKFGSEAEQHSMYEFLSNPFASYQFFANGVNIDEDALDCEIGEFFDGNNLESLVSLFYQNVKDDAIILADSFSYSCDPFFCYELYSVGGELHTYLRNRGAEKHFDIAISDIKAWLGTTRTKELSTTEKAFLKEIV